MNDEIRKIELDKISDFPNHPFKVVDDDKMQEMVESIKQNGIIIPAIVREKDDGTYEMISGHRRKRALKLAKINEIPCIIRNLTDEEAILLMVDTNLNQREEILPSEKAKAYKMKLEALKHQGERNDLIKNAIEKVGKILNDDKDFNEECEQKQEIATSAPLGPKLNRSNEIVAKSVGDSREQVRRYIRLTELIPEILNMVDEKEIAFRPAVELSYLSEENQYSLLDIMQFLDSTPSLAQAIYIKKLEQEGKLTIEKLEKIMGQEKPNQIEKVKINAERFEKVFPKNLKTNQEKEDFLYMCVEEHNKRERKKEKER